MKKLCLFLWIIGIVACFAGCSRTATDERTGFLSESDLEGYILYVHNVTCSKVNEVRTVTDSDFLEKITELSITVEQFRPVLSSDMILGKEPEETVIFENKEGRYIISFDDAEKKLSLYYFYRDEPIVSFSKIKFDDYGQPQIMWQWYCTMSAADYATAFEMIRTYSDGEIVEQ